jgi:hypothetical protein
VPDLLIPSILVALFCCQPGGIIAIIYAAQANGSKTAGDYARAAQQARTAKTWIWISVATGVAVYLIWGLVMVSGGMAMH